MEVLCVKHYFHPSSKLRCYSAMLPIQELLSSYLQTSILSSLPCSVDFLSYSSTVQKSIHFSFRNLRSWIWYMCRPPPSWVDEWLIEMNINCLDISPPPLWTLLNSFRSYTTVVYCMPLWSRFGPFTGKYEEMYAMLVSIYLSYTTYLKWVESDSVLLRCTATGGVWHRPPKYTETTDL